MLEARPHLELYRTSMEQRGLAASTVDRRLATHGFYRFAYIDGRIGSNPAHYVRRPTVHPSERRGLDRSELGGMPIQRAEKSLLSEKVLPAVKEIGTRPSAQQRGRA